MKMKALVICVCLPLFCSCSLTDILTVFQDRLQHEVGMAMNWDDRVWDLVDEAAEHLQSIAVSAGDLPTAEELHVRFPAVAAQVDQNAIGEEIASANTPQPGDIPDESNHSTSPQRRTGQWCGPREDVDRYGARQCPAR